MSISDFFRQYWQEGLLYLFIGGGLIQISPLKWNPLSWLARKIGKALNADVLSRVDEIDKKVDEVESKLDKHIVWNKSAMMEQTRRNILKFSEELRHTETRQHSEESFHQILKDIKDYKLYCEENPRFENNRAVHAISYIEDEYDRCLRENDFIGKF